MFSLSEPAAKKFFKTRSFDTAFPVINEGIFNVTNDCDNEQCDHKSILRHNPPLLDQRGHIITMPALRHPITSSTGTT